MSYKKHFKPTKSELLIKNAVMTMRTCKCVNDCWTHSSQELLFWTLLCFFIIEMKFYMNLAGYSCFSTNKYKTIS